MTSETPRGKAQRSSIRKRSGPPRPEDQRDRQEPRHPDDVDADLADKQQAPKESGGEARGPESDPTKIPDANKGREYQGTGIPNRKGRFGSSEKPADLGKDEASE